MRIDRTNYKDKHLTPIEYCLKHFKKQFCINNSGVIIGEIVYDPSAGPDWKNLYGDDYYKHFRRVL